jgi:hypothetical protein
VKVTVRRSDALVIDLPARAYRDGERVRVSVDDTIAKYVDPSIPVVITIGGVIDPSYPVYAKDGRRFKAGDVLDGREHVVAVVAENGGKFMAE